MSHYSRSSAHTLSRIRALLAEGLDPAKIVERLGVATSTVYAVQAGRAKPRVCKRKERKPDGHGIVYPDAMDEPVWCEECHARVRPPCLACATRKWMKKNQKKQRSQK